MKVNPLVKVIMEEARNVKLKPNEVQNRIDYKKAAKLKYNPREYLIQELPSLLTPKVFSKFLEVKNIILSPGIKALEIKLKPMIDGIVNLDIVRSDANEAEKMLAMKKVRRNLNSLLRNDESAQQLLKCIVKLIDDKDMEPIVKVVGKATDSLLGNDIPYDEFLYKSGATGREWKLRKMQKSLSKNGVLAGLKDILTYFIKKDPVN